MSLIKSIMRYHSLSIVGMEKNTGKTECLNYILNSISSNKSVAVTSIGIDGETVDQVTSTKKPEITLRKGVFYGTSEMHFKSRKLVSPIVALSEERTSLGRIVTAQVKEEGKIMLSGPSSKSSLIKWMNEGKKGLWNDEIHQNKKGIDLFIVDGALSRLSSASPAISESMILSTGASLSNDMKELVEKTSYTVELMSLKLAHKQQREKLSKVSSGVWAIDQKGKLIDLGIPSSLSINGIDYGILENCKVLYLKGALVDGFLDKLMQNKKLSSIQIIVDDFTKVFVSRQKYNLFIKKGGKIKVMEKSKLIAVSVNPTSPNGIVMESKILQQKLKESLLKEGLNVPVYDVKEL